MVDCILSQLYYSNGKSLRDRKTNKAKKGGCHK